MPNATITTRVVPPAEKTQRRAIRFLDRLFAGVDTTGLAIRLWDGTVWRHEDGSDEPKSTVVLNHPGALRRMFLPPGDLSAGRAFVEGDFDIDGDVELVCSLARKAGEARRSTSDGMALLSALLALPATSSSTIDGRGDARLEGSAHSKRRDADAIRYHYDVGNDFYALWLDENLTYSCGYFRSPDDDLDAAQRAKYELICSKLRVKPGERVLDIGCGWGGLVRHIAREHDAEVVGITLSPSQAELARERIAGEGLGDTAKIELLDYRDAPSLGTFDKLVSVGMFEHVGVDKLGTYFETAKDLLKPGGLFLNHGIATAGGKQLVRKNSFLHHYVFPDGELESIAEVLSLAEEAGFEVRDVESLREHYMLTLRHWVQRLEDRAAEAVRLTDEATYRVWRLYMAASADAFRNGSSNVYQSLLYKPTGDVSGLPLTRDYLTAG